MLYTIEDTKVMVGCTCMHACMHPPPFIYSNGMHIQIPAAGSGCTAAACRGRGRGARHPTRTSTGSRLSDG